MSDETNDPKTDLVPIEPVSDTRADEIATPLDAEQASRYKQLCEIRESGERLLGLMQEPETINIICAHVASGGSLIDYAKLWRVSYGVLLNWINADLALKDKYRQSLLDRNEYDRELIRKTFRDAATTNIRDAYNDDNTLKSIHEMSESTTNAIDTVRTRELFDNDGNKIGNAQELKMQDKLKAALTLGKHLGDYVEKVEHSGSISWEEILHNSYEKPKPEGGQPI
jgi:hypothetical protein